jgi:hypothetical protein
MKEIWDYGREKSMIVLQNMHYRHSILALISRVLGRMLRILDTNKRASKENIQIMYEEDEWKNYQHN